MSYYKKYPWKKTLVVIKQRCNNPNNKSYKDYGGRGIKCSINEYELKKLWFRDKAYEMTQSTISRKNHDLNYIYDNCEYLEKRKNSAERNKRVSSKTILQYDLNDNFIKEWFNGSQVRKELGLNPSGISKCCLGNYNQCGGFKWRFKND